MSLSKDNPFVHDTFVVLPQENSIETGTVHNIANNLRDLVMEQDQLLRFTRWEKMSVFSSPLRSRWE